jgi:hypothetical protein
MVHRDCLRQRWNYISLAEIIALKEQGFASGFRERVREAVPKVQPCRMAAFAIVGKRFAREQGMFDSDWLDRNGCAPEK